MELCSTVLNGWLIQGSFARVIGFLGLMAEKLTGRNKPKHSPTRPTRAFRASGSAFLPSFPHSSLEHF
jgi:hypothetical protein